MPKMYILGEAGTSNDINGLPLDNLPDTVLGDCGLSIKQTSKKLLNEIMINTQTAKLLATELNDRPQFEYVSGANLTKLKYTGSTWRIEYLVNGTLITAWEVPATSSTYPQKEGWAVVLGFSPTPHLTYDSFWINDDGELVKIYYADLKDRINLSQKQADKWSKRGAILKCHDDEIKTYSQDFNETEKWFNLILTWIGEQSCGTHMEPVVVDGVVVMHDGEIVVIED